MRNLITRTATFEKETLSIAVSPQLVAQADHLLGVLGRLLERGERIEDRPIQFGWSSITCRRQATGGLMVFERDLMGDPFNREMPGANCTLWVLADQLRFADENQVSPVVTGFHETIVVEPNWLREKALVMIRTDRRPEQQDDSGWFIGVRGRDHAHSELQAMPVFALLQQRPELMRALILPSGFVVLVGPEGVESVHPPE